MNSTKFKTQFIYKLQEYSGIIVNKIYKNVRNQAIV